jgi:hypothetical protein
VRASSRTLRTFGCDNPVMSEPCRLPFPDDLVNAVGEPRRVRVYQIGSL